MSFINSGVLPSDARTFLKSPSPIRSLPIFLSPFSSSLLILEPILHSQFSFCIFQFAISSPDFRPILHSIRGGPWLIRSRSLFSPPVQTDSIHQVAPASANARTVSAALVRFFPGVEPPAMISNPDLLWRFFFTYEATWPVNSGLALSDGEPLYR